MIDIADKAEYCVSTPNKYAEIKAIVTEHYWVQLNNWYKNNGRHTLPWRTNRSAWSILVAEVLLRRTRANTVARVFPNIIEIFSDSSSVLKKRDKWLRLTSELGFPSRFIQFFDACKIIKNEYSDKVPIEEKQLISLPGIGHYSSDAIRCFGLGHNRFLVDTNTLRISSRLSGFHIEQGKHRTTAARHLLKMTFGNEDKMTADRNFALLDFAALVCKPSSPKCIACPLLYICVYGKENIYNHK